MNDPGYQEARERMVEIQLRARDIRDERVLEAMRVVARHLFIPEDMRRHAYNDEPLPIGEGQTISQPYIVAYMTQILELQPYHNVLEIGTGSGYQTAILAEMVESVCSVEILPDLTNRARKVLAGLEYGNIRFRTGDGARGWDEFAPYDGIMVTAAPETIPETLQEQLREGGRMILPVGVTFQDLVLVTRGRRKFNRKTLIPVRFVPLIRSS
ncbi:MAG: protein-L-isoaspartate(D-aspartate) O-methyltransferase [Candidatus Aminicenantaceae bacterium]|jgi:protein-L-isoaspartate(D-aspartate) O-methyltransferase